MKNANTETTEPTNLNEPELENVNGGARAVLNLDAFITVLTSDKLRNMVGMDRPKGLLLPTKLGELTTNIGDLSTSIKVTRGL